MATLRITGDQDYSGAVLTDVTRIEFVGSARATFSADQFGSGGIAANVEIVQVPDGTGSPSARPSMTVRLASSTSFDASGWRVATDPGGSGVVDVTLVGTDAADTIVGSSVADRLIGGPGFDELYGGDGNDSFVLGPNEDPYRGNPLSFGRPLIDGGAGFDEIVVGASASFMSGPKNAPFVGSTVVRSVEGVRFDAAADTIFYIDKLAGFDPDLLVTGDAHANTFQVTWYERFNFLGSDIDLSGWQFADWTEDQDRVSITWNGDRIIGTRTDDTIFALRGDSLAPPVFVDGGDGDDVIRTYTEGSTLAGGAGHDIVYGGTGTDAIYGGLGDDRLEGQDGRDYLYGEAGDDLLYGEGGIDALFGGAGNDLLVGGGDAGDYLYGEAGADALYGEGGTDALYGGAGDDAVNGQGGSDHLYGEAGRDRIDGGDGDDSINGGAGDDVLFGGGGADYFYFDGPFGLDAVLDFEVGVDRLVFSAAQVNPGGVSRDYYAAANVTVFGADDGQVYVTGNVGFGDVVLA